MSIFFLGLIYNHPRLNRNSAVEVPATIHRASPQVLLREPSSECRASRHYVADLHHSPASVVARSTRPRARLREQCHRRRNYVPRQRAEAQHGHVLFYSSSSPHSLRWRTHAVASPIRTVATDGPVTNVSDPDLACGVGALDAPVDAPVYPGSAINFTWVSGSGGNVRILLLSTDEQCRPQASLKLMHVHYR